MYCAMRDVRLIEIEASCWKGHSFVIRFDGRVCTVSGRNGIGKTCVYMSYLWLLTGYTDALNARNHLLYDCSCAIDEHTPMASVRGVFEVDGGVVELFRGARPRFVCNKMDGTYRRLSSDEYVYKVNGVSLSSSEYNDYISSSFGLMSLLPYALNGERFTSLLLRSKQSAMDLLIEISGQNVALPVDVDESSCRDDIRLYNERLTGLSAVIADRERDLTSVGIPDAADIDKKRDLLERAKEDLSSLLCDGEHLLYEKQRLLSSREAALREQCELECTLKDSVSLTDGDRDCINARILELDSEIARLGSDMSSIKLDELSERMRDGVDALCSLSSEVVRVGLYSEWLSRIEDLRAQAREAADIWAKRNGELERIKRSRHEACSSIIHFVNDGLSECRIVLQSSLKGGDARPDVVMETLDGVAYSTANNSQRSRMCVDIQRMLMRRIGSMMPIFIDEANKFSTNNIPAYDGQVILLCVNDSPTIEVSVSEPWS